MSDRDEVGMFLKRAAELEHSLLVRHLVLVGQVDPEGIDLLRSIAREELMNLVLVGQVDPEGIEVLIKRWRDEAPDAAFEAKARVPAR
jgi:hypothetical protein